MLNEHICLLIKNAGQRCEWGEQAEQAYWQASWGRTPAPPETLHTIARCAHREAIEARSALESVRWLAQRPACIGRMETPYSDVALKIGRLGRRVEQLETKVAKLPCGDEVYNGF